jgi:ubiquinone/menaquinone biosynthesis C-methylase UbiE
MNEMKKGSKTPYYGYYTQHICADDRLFPFGDNSFVVTSSSILNNVHSDEQKLKAIKDISKVLKPGEYFSC